MVFRHLVYCTYVCSVDINRTSNNRYYFTYYKECRLDDRRVNKVNLRKEFFDVTIDELEKLVNEICPTAEFTRTMLAEEYRQSLSCSESYTSDYVVDETEDDIE